MGREPIREIDRDILEALEKSRQATPAFIAKIIDRDRRYVANRLSYLAKNGVITKVMRGIYRLKG
jgi:DNA-binding Lrp family transcriptional regulator